jgi:hypothetical protein
MAERRNDLIDLISAVASGDASREDVVADLRKKKIDALDLLIEVFARQAKASSRQTPGERVDVQALSQRSDAPTKPVQRVPGLPVLLRGTLYDPADITRFDGTELHFIATGKDHILAIDDRAIMENLWQTSYLASMARSDYTTMKETTDTSVPTVTDGGVRPTSVDGGYTGGYTCAWVTPTAPNPHTNFYEDINYGGDRLELASGFEIPKLSGHHLGPFWSGDDWNDNISSIQMVRTEATVIFEHVNKTGQSFSFFRSEPNLVNLGWNDRASSAVTWGATAWLAVPTLVCGPYNPTG